jgi:hypothetical protein
VFVMLLLLHFFLRDDEWWINHQTTKSDDVKHGTIISLLYRITQIVWYYCVIKYKMFPFFSSFSILNLPQDITSAVYDTQTLDKKSLPFVF